MAEGPITAHDRDRLAASDDIRRIFGALDEAKLLDILALRPTIFEVEEASVWLSGDADVFGGRPLRPVAGEIVAILTGDEEEEQPPR
jgi:hypothetical protein